MKFPQNTIKLSGGIKYEPTVGSWDSITEGLQQRKRKGLHYNFDYYGNGGDYPTGNLRQPFNQLTANQMWQIYQQCADVRAAIDSIVRRVATYDWNVIPSLDPKDENYMRFKRKAEEVKEFFNTPNSNGYTFQEVLTSMLTDCLVFDSGVFEIVYDRAGNLKELVPLRGSSVVPMIDEHGKIVRYVQDVMAEGQGFYGNINLVTAEGVGKEAVENVMFKKEQIMFLSLFPNTSNPSGNPLLESLVNEVISVMRGSQHAMLALDADEIPPGILVLAGIAGKAAEQAKADLRTLKGQDHKIRVMTTPDPQGMAANWLELRRTPKEISMRELVEDIRRSIYRVFGVQPVEMGMTEGMPRATAHVQLDVSTSHLVTPILELLQAKINHQILPLLLDEDEIPYVKFIFDRESRLPPEERNRVASAHQIYVKNGIMSRNEIRDELGLLPVEGGDVLTLEVAGMPTSLDAVVANKVYPVKIANQPTEEDKEADIKDDEPGVTDSEVVSLSLNTVNTGVFFEERPSTSSQAPFVLEPTSNEVQLGQKVADMLEKSKYGIYQDISKISTQDINEKLRTKTPDYLTVDMPFMPYPDDYSTRKEVEYLKKLAIERDEETMEFINMADRSIGKLFILLLNKNGIYVDDYLKEDIERVLVETTIPVLKLKYLYNRARPYQVADIEGIEFSAIDSESAKTPSYPSGHATQSMYLAYYLTKSYPDLSSQLMALGERIAWSRVVAGVHFPSDISFGMVLYNCLVAKDKELNRAVGDKEPTNFPAKGDDKKVSLRNSEHKLFPKGFAERIKSEYPSIWAKGGNIKGNDQYSILTKIRDNNNGSPKTASQEQAIRLREAWAARHFKDFQLAGVIAQIKWLVIGSRGVSHMKSVVNEAISKLK